MFVLRFLDVLLFLLTAGNIRPEPGDGSNDQSVTN